MRRKIYDAIVVGAGPAGATVSRKLAEKGMDVLILEKSRLPRDKPCGGGITTPAWNLLADIDLSPVIEDSVRKVEATFNNWRLASVLIPPVYMVVRKDFDHLLIKASVDNNAKLMDGQKVTAMRQKKDHVIVTTGETDFYSKVVIGADGVNSTVAKLAGIPVRRKAAFGVLGTIRPKSPAQLDAWRGKARIDIGAVASGYGWVFPKRDHLSVGIYSKSPRMIKNMRGRLMAFLARMGFLDSGEIGRIRGGHIPLSRKGGFHQERTLLVGDAAGLASLMTGEGILYAILSGQAAASVIDNFLTAQVPDLSSYTHYVNNVIDNLRPSRLPIELFGFALAARSVLIKLLGLCRSR
jgi:geranylgeranyl reductase family protein